MDLKHLKALIENLPEDTEIKIAEYFNVHYVDAFPVVSVEYNEVEKALIFH